MNESVLPIKESVSTLFYSVGNTLPPPSCEGGNKWARLPKLAVYKSGVTPTDLPTGLGAHSQRKKRWANMKTYENECETHGNRQEFIAYQGGFL